MLDSFNVMVIYINFTFSTPEVSNIRFYTLGTIITNDESIYTHNETDGSAQAVILPLNIR